MALKAPGGRAPSDRAFRDRIRDSTGTNLLVEAAAGTGKTTSLVDRMVALVRGGTPVDRLCAVTFTIKAAAQLDQKFQNALERAARDETEAAERIRVETALARLDACFIGTIHAFCSRLLRERPVEAGLDPGFEEMDEAEDTAARAEAWKRYADRLYTEGSPILGKVLDAGLELDWLRGAFDLLCEHGDVAAAAAPECPPPDLSASRRELDAYLDRVAEELPKSVPPAGWDKLQVPLRAALRMRGLVDLASTPQLVSVFKELAFAKKPDTPSWYSAQAAKRAWREFEEFKTATMEPALALWREHLHPIAIAAVAPAVEEYREWRRRESRLNFQDQLLYARNLLREHPSVRRALQERFTPVLVDEFQDTDPIQAEVLLYLTGSDIEQKDWRRLTPVPGSLFVVGDPKQSIYRFRRADIQTYDTVSEILRRSGGEILKLSANFRSTPQMCAWINEVFASIFPAERTTSQAAHVALDPFRESEGAASPDAADANVYRIEVPSTPASEIARADSERVADAIAAALRGEGPLAGSGRASPEDFLVLSRRRVNLPLYARALESRGIPYEIAGGGAFRDSEEIAALLAVLEAVADPENPVPLVAALRGPLFGIDDESLYHFQQAGGRFDLRSSASPRSDARIRRAYQLLSEGADLVEKLPPAAALARFVERLGSVALAAGGSLGDARAGNLLKALATARELSRQRASYAEIVRTLRELTEDDLVEEMVTRPGRSDVVRLMTLHRAKGLEARVVFLADPTKPKEWPPEIWIDRSSEPPLAHVLVARDRGIRSDPEEIARPDDWDEKRNREKEFFDRENERLLYVAATRARDALVVSFRRNQNGDLKGPWERLQSHVRRELPRFASASMSAPASAEPEADSGLTSKSLETFRARRAERRDLASRPSYSATSVTALAHTGTDPAERPFVSGTGKGMSWGSALHRLLDAAMRDPNVNLRALAVNVLAEEDRPPEDLDDALAAVEGVRGSALWKRALAGKRCLTEVPFALSTGANPETLLSGAIDLVFEETDGWVLVDYKSDTVSENLEALVRFYEPQLSRYRTVWKGLTGRPTKAGLFFLDGGREVWLEESKTGA